MAFALASAVAYSFPFFEYPFVLAFVSFRVVALPAVAIAQNYVEAASFADAHNSAQFVLAGEQVAPHNFFVAALSFPVWVKHVAVVHLVYFYAPVHPFLC